MTSGSAAPLQSASGPSVAGRTIIVTGAAQGLGAQIALLLGRAGARIVLADLRAESARAHATELRDAGIDACAMTVDVGDDARVQQLVEAVIRQYGRIDVLVNNAAVDVTAPIDELSSADWERVIRTNLTGPFLMARHVAAAMIAAGTGDLAGHIVNIASTASKRAWPNASAYHASKWGLLGLSHALHAELRPRGIKVSAIVAGGMRTPFLLDRFADIDPGTLQDPANVARAVHFVLTQPEETVIPELMVLPMRETSWP